MDATISGGGLGPGKEQRRQQNEERLAAPLSTQLRHDWPHRTRRLGSREPPAVGVSRSGAGRPWLRRRAGGRRVQVLEAREGPRGAQAPGRPFSDLWGADTPSPLEDSGCTYAPLNPRGHPEPRPRLTAAPHLPVLRGRLSQWRTLGSSSKVAVKRRGGAHLAGRGVQGAGAEGGHLKVASPPMAHLGPPPRREGAGFALIRCRRWRVVG